MPHNDVPIEPAATLILIRDSRNGPQILMQQRSPEAAFVGGAWVFPGGKVDPADFASDWLHHCKLDTQKANQLLELEKDAHAYWVAAIRETIEEAGILLAETACEKLAQQTQQHLQQNPDQFLRFCQQRRLQLHTAKIKYLSRWVTPEGSPKRYDTRFFLAPWPEDQPAKQDDHEAINTLWVTPQQALNHHDNGDWLLIFPTIMTLKQLCQYDSCEAILDNLGKTAL